MTTHHPTPASTDAAFDQAARALHARALDRLSTPTRARLQAARAAASAGSHRPPRHGLGWGLAGGLVAVCALAIGLQWRAGPGVDPRAPTAVTATTDPTDDASDLLATLDENPDFYLWLASPDALPATQEL